MYMAGVPQWFCIGTGVASASLVVFFTFRLNEKYGEHGLMKLGAAKYRPCHLLNRRKIARMFKRKCLTDKKKEE